MEAISVFRKSILFILILISGLNLQAQLIDADTTRVIQKEVKTEEEVHSPRKATIYSAILPGLGQAYNKKYWKIPFVYAGFFGIGYFIDWNNDNYQMIKSAYKDLTDTDETTTSYLKLKGIEYYDLTSTSDISDLKTVLTKRQDYYRRNRDLLVISMFGFYGLNIIDASVDAHLFNFDISDDLTMFWQPSMLNVNNELVYCVNFTINF